MPPLLHGAIIAAHDASVGALGTRVGTGGRLPSVPVRVFRRVASLREGVRLVRGGDHPLAVRTLLGVVMADDARAHYYLGVAYARIGARTGAMTLEYHEAGRLAAGGPLGEVAKLELQEGNTP